MNRLKENLVESYDLSSPDLINRNQNYEQLIRVISKANQEDILIADFNKIREIITETVCDEHTLEILELYFGLNGEKLTYEEIGKKIGKSRTRIQQITKTALRKIRLKYDFKEYFFSKSIIREFVEKFFENHDIFYNSEEHELDEQIRNELMEIYQKCLERKENHEWVKERSDEELEILKEIGALDEKKMLLTEEFFRKRKKIEHKRRIEGKLDPKLKIELLDFSTRVYTALRRHDIDTIDKLISKSKIDIMKMGDLGEKSWNEIIEKVHSLGYKFEHEIPIEEKKAEDIRIESLGFSRRTYTVLCKYDISTIDKLISKSTIDIMKMRNLGKKTYDEIIEKVHSLGYKFADEEPGEEKEDEDTEIRIESLGLSTRVYNVFRMYEIDTIGKLISKSKIDIMKMEGLGQKSYDEIIEKVHSLGYKFADEEPIEEKKDEGTEIRIASLGFSRRAYTVLCKYDIDTIDKLISKSTIDIMKMINLGKKTYDEIIEKVHSLGYKFADEEPGEEKEDTKGENEKQEISEEKEQANQGEQEAHEKKEEQGSLDIQLANTIKDLKNAYMELNCETKKCGENKSKLIKRLQEIKSEVLSTEEKVMKIGKMIESNAEFLNEIGELEALKEKKRQAEQQLLSKREQEQQVQSKIEKFGER